MAQLTFNKVLAVPGVPDADALYFVKKSATSFELVCSTSTATILAHEAATVADDSVTTAKIVDDAVTLAKMADDSVGADQIITGGVGTAEIADNAVTNIKMADDSVGTAELKDGAVDWARLATAVQNVITSDSNAYSGHGDDTTYVHPGTSPALKDGDFYFDLDNGDKWVYITGAWTSIPTQINMKYVQAGVPAAGFGTDMDEYTDSASGAMYWKMAGAWTQVNAMKIIQATDTPAAYGTTGQVLVINAAADGFDIVDQSVEWTTSDW